MRASITKRRARAMLAGTVVALGVLAAACGPAVVDDPPPPGCPTSPPDAMASTILNRVNADRGANGLGGLSWNARLACLSAEWSGVMAGRGGLAHRDLNATIRSPGFGAYAGLAENVYQGPSSADANGIHSAWMNSAGHRNNILGNFTQFGFGWVRGGDGRLWATENFGRYL